MRRVVTASTAALAAALLVAAPSHADEVVVPGTAFPAGSTYLSWFGCEGLFAPATAGPRTTIVRDDEAPAGERATSLSMPGPGSAAGPVSQVSSVADAAWSMWVQAADGGQGVGHVWYVSSELDNGQVWAGRADLAATPGDWHEVRPASATYSWSKYDAVTGELLEPAGKATVADFTDRHGDGPGYLMAGFGCDGEEFELDRLTSGDPGEVTTYDLEGFGVATVIDASTTRVARGAEVTLTGATLDGLQQATGAPLVLEARPQGAIGFTPAGRALRADAAGRVIVTVSPDRTTDYRWHQPTTGYADEGWSDIVTVHVGR